MDYEVLGKVDTIELKKGGADIPVTEENKEEYLRCLRGQFMTHPNTFKTLNSEICGQRDGMN